MIKVIKLKVYNKTYVQYKIQSLIDFGNSSL